MGLLSGSCSCKASNIGVRLDSLYMDLVSQLMKSSSGASAAHPSRVCATSSAPFGAKQHWMGMLGGCTTFQRFREATHIPSHYCNRLRISHLHHTVIQIQVVPLAASPFFFCHLSAFPGFSFRYKLTFHLIIAIELQTPHFAPPSYKYKSYHLPRAFFFCHPPPQSAFPVFSFT